MKKFLLLLSLIVFPFMTVWQNIDTDTLQDINPRDKWLWLISFWFCNEWNDRLSSNLNYAVQSGKPFKVCSTFYNGANEDITINIRIVDQWYTAQWDKTCIYDSTNIQKFMNQEDLQDLESITLPAGEYVTKEFELLFPIGVEWKQSACYTFYIPKESSSEWVSISAIINKFSFMDFFVWWMDDIKNEIKINNIQTYLDGNKDLNLDFTLSNEWNLEDEVIIVWEVTNIFWFKKEFTIEWKWIQLAPGKSTPVSATLWSLPTYGGLFNIKLNITATPFFSYDISKSNIDPNLLEEKVFTVTTTYFQMPWMMLIVVAMFIIILYLLFRKNK